MNILTAQIEILCELVDISEHVHSPSFFISLFGGEKIPGKPNTSLTDLL